MNCSNPSCPISQLLQKNSNSVKKQPTVRMNQVFDTKRKDPIKKVSNFDALHQKRQAALNKAFKQARS